MLLFIITRGYLQTGRPSKTNKEIKQQAPMASPGCSASSSSFAGHPPWELNSRLRPYARAVPADRDKQIDQLYSAPLGEFVERRNEFARSLRKDGNRRVADEVRRLRKPTLPAWTVNQLARREKMRLRGLLTAGERLRKAHEEVLVGGPPEALQQGRGAAQGGWSSSERGDARAGQRNAPCGCR
jgi:hypothetical protein